MKQTALEDLCLARAEALAAEVNGDLSYVPDDDMISCLEELTEDNVEEIAQELASLAHWFN